jgi:hypothetical protein
METEAVAHRLAASAASSVRAVRRSPLHGCGAGAGGVMRLPPGDVRRTNGLPE